VSGAVRRLVTAAALAVVLSGCGQAANPERTAVARYLTRVQKVETAFTKPLGEVTQDGDQFAQHNFKSSSVLGREALAAEESSLLRAATQIDALRARLASLASPAAAAQLRALLLKLAQRQAALAREVAGIVVFVPSFSAVLEPLRPATQRLAHVLADNTASSSGAVADLDAAKASALRRFAATVQTIETGVRRLHPPAISAPGYRTQLVSLQGMSQTAGELATALTSADNSRIAPLLVRFDHAATLNATVGAQRAQIAAVRAYDAQVDSVSRLVDRIDTVRYRLDSTLPEG
jgi:division protein CdvB (Snf7/Vps24/ESCRT-III family)